MPTVIERINISVDSDGLDGRIGEQVAQIQQVVELIAGLIDDPPDDVGDFLDLASNLPLPEFSFGGDFGAALNAARDALPADLGDLTGVVDGDLGSFATLVSERLQPLLEDAVKVARDLEALVSLDLHCNVGAAAGGGGGGGGGGDGDASADDAPNAGAERLSTSASQVQQVNDLLDRLPADLDPGGALELLFGLSDVKSRNAFAQLYLPVVDDIIEPLRTLNRWQRSTPGEIASELAATLDALRERLRAATSGRVDTLGDALDTLLPQMQLPALATFGSDYASALDALIAALEAGDAAATVAPVGALDGAVDGLATTLDAWHAGVAESVRTALAGVDGLSNALLDDTSHLLTLLEPVEFPRQAVSLMPEPQAPDAETVAAVRDAVRPVLDWLEELIALLDFSAIQSEVASVATDAQALADGIESGITGVAVQVQSLFDNLTVQMASVDLVALQSQANGEIERFGVQLESSLKRGFDPAASAITQAVDTLSSALDSFDPAAIVAALEEVLSAITGVLDGPEVQDAVNEVRDAIAKVTEALERLSFEPVTDEVVGLIEQMTAALRTLGETDLNDAARVALSTAMSVLPESLEPVTEPLLAEFDGLVQSEAIPLLERVASKPAELLSQITRFQPADLIGDRLSAPFNQALERAEAFTPGNLLAEVDSALDVAKRRLVDSAGPSRALGALEEPFRTLRGEITRYSPDAVLAPLEARIEGAVAKVVEASPVDEIFAEVNRVFAIIEAGLDIPRNLIATGQRVNNVLDGFADSDAAIDTWRDAMLDKVASMTDLGAVAAALDAGRDAITESAHAALLTRIQDRLRATSDALAGLDPGRQVTALVGRHGRARALTLAQPDSPERSAALAALDRLQPSRLAPLTLAHQLQQALASAADRFDILSVQWRDMIEDADGPLAELATIGADSAGLRTLLANAVEPVLAPMRYLFKLLASLRPAVSEIIATLQGLLDDLTSGVAALLTGPSSLQAISDAVQQIVDVLRNIDLGFLREGLQTVFASVLEQIDVINPAALGAALDDAFEDLLEPFNVDLLIPAGAVSTLDAQYQAVLVKLRALDPQALVTDVVQPQYEATVVPLVQAFDLTPAFDALIEFLAGLAEELDGELGRVNGAYQNLRAARPGGGASVNVNVSV